MYKAQESREKQTARAYAESEPDRAALRLLGNVWTQVELSRADRGK
jgi:hypothetical protein